MKCRVCGQSGGLVVMRHPQAAQALRKKPKKGESVVFCRHCGRLYAQFGVWMLPAGD